MTGLIDTNLGINCAIEVVAAGIDPRIIRTKLDSANVMRRGDRAACVPVLDSVDVAFILDTKRAALWEFVAARRQIIVHEKLPCSHSLRERN